jgi:hypothetical protein
MAPRKVFIFDIDSVLVDPIGYRKAVRATQSYFTHAMGLTDGVLVDNGIYTLFEASRVTSEWDMVPIALAILLEEILEKHPLPSQTNDLETCIQAIRRLPAESLPERIDYRTPIQSLGEYFQPGNYPANQVMQLALANLRGIEDISKPGFPEFPVLVKTPLMEILLGHTREIDRSPTTRLFQQFSLGSRTFTQTYDLLPDVETPGFLLEYDRPLLSKSLSEKIVQLFQSGELALCAYTMRPSLPPREAQTGYKGYAPEAEMALKLVNLSAMPLIGYGRILYLAQQGGWPAEKMLKPSPVQAIAAILAAVTGNELSSLQTALRIYQGEEKDSHQIVPREGISVHIFEDSAGGIEAMRLAGDILSLTGMRIQIHPYGISDNFEKEATLQRSQVPIFPTTEAAVIAALQPETY